MIFEFDITNVGADPLSDVYVGLYVDLDVAHVSTTENNGGMQDDITGFLHAMPARVGHGYLDTVNVAWIADNDGDPTGTDSTNARLRVPPACEYCAPPAPGRNTHSTGGSPITEWPGLGAEQARQSGRIRTTAIWGHPSETGPSTRSWPTASSTTTRWSPHSITRPEDGCRPCRAQRWRPNLANGFDTRYLLAFGPFRRLPRIRCCP